MGKGLSTHNKLMGKGLSNQQVGRRKQRDKYSRKVKDSIGDSEREDLVTALVNLEIAYVLDLRQIDQAHLLLLRLREHIVRKTAQSKAR